MFDGCISVLAVWMGDAVMPECAGSISSWVDRTADQTNEADAIAFEIFGVETVVGVGPPELARRVRESLPAARRESQVGADEAEVGIYADPEGGYRVVGPNGAQSGSSDLREGIERLRASLLEHVALHAQDHLFVRGGAVVIGGQAIVLAGAPAEGGSELLSALVGDGATVYADGCVPIDGSGQVHPDPLQVWTSDGNAPVAGGMPAPVAVLATLTRRQGEALWLREELSETGVLALLRNAWGADERPEFALAVAREVTGRAAVVEGQWDRPEEASAALIERLARVPRRTPERTELPAAIQFVSLVLELEGQLAGLAETLEAAGVDAVLLNGDEARPALAHGFALSYSALIEVPRSQVPRALGAMEAAGWRPVRHATGSRYFRQGVIAHVRPRSPAAGLIRARKHALAPIIKGRLGLPEPESKVTAGKPQGSLTPQAFDPGDPGPLRTGSIGGALGLASEGLTVLDTLALRTREREFRGLPVQYGPGVHAFESTLEGLVDEVLDRLPSAAARPLVVDMGTGTGILALSIARERPDAQVLATDVSLRALGWARRNRRRLGVSNVRLAQGSLLAPVPTAWRGRVAAIVSNPPMALPAHAVELRARFDWPVGTATGPAADGLGLVRALAREARAVLAPGGHLHIEMLGHQGPWMEKYLGELGYEAAIPITGSYISVAARWPGQA
jgi:release factor glutamine methyltransferase